MEKQALINLYFKNKLSMVEIAKKLEISEHKVVYWMNKYNLKRRPLSEAIYLKYNPNGDPFRIKDRLSLEEVKLLGLGLGIYWGEGHKAGRAVRVSNTDPNLIKEFIKFLVKICQVDKNRLRFWLQIFGDTEEKEAIKYWSKKIGIRQNSSIRLLKRHLEEKELIGRRLNMVSYQ